MDNASSVPFFKKNLFRTYSYKIPPALIEALEVGKITKRDFQENWVKVKFRKYLITSGW